MAGKAWEQEHEVAAHTASSQEAERDGCGPHSEWVFPSTLTQSRNSLIDRCEGWSQVILSSAKLTTDINYWASKMAQWVKSACH